MLTGPCGSTYGYTISGRACTVLQVSIQNPADGWTVYHGDFWGVTDTGANAYSSYYYPWPGNVAPGASGTIAVVFDEPESTRIVQLKYKRWTGETSYETQFVVPASAPHAYASGITLQVTGVQTIADSNCNPNEAGFGCYDVVIDVTNGGAGDVAASGWMLLFQGSEGTKSRVALPSDASGPLPIPPGGSGTVHVHFKGYDGYQPSVIRYWHNDWMPQEIKAPVS